ncbi:hypothetical protein [Melittangium boletus]|uniref:hypothetical protein n=1 Tax=Melittangium boletus TaxID=83453 RepID=UPI003DA5769E
MSHAPIDMAMWYADRTPEARESAVQQLEQRVFRAVWSEVPEGHTKRSSEEGTKKKPSNPFGLLGFSFGEEYGT